MMSRTMRKKHPIPTKNNSICQAPVAAVGLGLILIQCSAGPGPGSGSDTTNYINSNTVVKPSFRLLITPKFKPSTPPASASYHQIQMIPIEEAQSYNLLKACHLCNKLLTPQMDVYMYRGDQGFCSIECRCRQIYMDEMKELDESTKAMLASSRHYYCSRSGLQTDPCHYNRHIQ